jgi:hypothetical protein
MRNLTLVTSFSPQGFELYGRRWIESFLLTFPPDTIAELHYEGPEHPEIPDPHNQLVWVPLDRDPDRARFIQEYSGPEHNDPRDYNGMSIRFCHKVFAVTNPELVFLQGTGWRVWSDADTCWARMPGVNLSRLLCQILPDDRALSCLLRTGQMRPGQPAYTECGFVGYNLDKREARETLERMRALYTSGEITRRGPHNRHDSYAFDEARKPVSLDLVHNLSGKAPHGQTHVWPYSPLSLIGQHFKGPRRKTQAYGGSL